MAKTKLGGGNREIYPLFHPPPYDEKVASSKRCIYPVQGYSAIFYDQND